MRYAATSGTKTPCSGRFTIVRTVLLSVLLAPPAAATVPGPVQNLVWCAGAPDCLAWSSNPFAVHYRIYRGEQASLPCLLNAALDSCLRATIVPPTTGPGALQEVPDSGRFYWFLVTAESANGEGPSGHAYVDGAARPRSRDTFGSCPSACTAAGGACLAASDCCSSNCASVCLSTCCAPQGAFCLQGSDCCSNHCVAGLCQPCLDLGASCGSPGACCSGNCSGGTCVPACVANGDLCNTGSQCCSGTCSAGSCQPCVRAGGFCNTGSQCCSGSCVASTCQSCLPAGATCTTGSQCCSGTCSASTCIGP